MKQEEKLIIEAAPADTSIYEEGEPAETEEISKEEYGSYSFLDVIKEVSINA